MTYLYMKF